MTLMASLIAAGSTLMILLYHLHPSFRLRPASFLLFALFGSLLLLAAGAYLSKDENPQSLADNYVQLLGLGALLGALAASFIELWGPDTKDTKARLAKAEAVLEQ